MRGKIVTRPAENNTTENDTGQTQMDDGYWWKVAHSMTTATVMRDEMQAGLHGSPVTI